MGRTLLILFILITGTLQAQPADNSSTRSLSHSVFLLGNTTQLPTDEARAALNEMLKQNTGSYTVLHLGDITPSRKDSVNTRSNIDWLLDLGRKAPDEKVYFVPGDKDWDNSKRDGWNNVKQLEKEISLRTDKSGILLPSSGCPGPEIIDLTNDLRIIVINTQWWMHPHRKPGITDNDCKCRTEQEFLDALEDAIQESAGKNLIIAGHHPVLSYGNYGGRIPFKRHLFPLPDVTGMQNVPLPGLGTIYAAYRQNVGTARDMAYPAYERFVDGMEKIFIKHDNLIYAASHEYNLQLNYTGNNYYVISGSISKREPVGDGEETLFSSSATGFSKLEYYTDGSIIARFYRIKSGKAEELYSRTLFQSPCADNKENGIPTNKSVTPCIEATTTVPAPSAQKYLTLKASEAYKAGTMKTLFFGERYRKEWMQPVNMPVINLDTAFGGLKAYDRGGGRQTLSLKFKAGNGNEYVFRSVDKDFTRTLAPKLKNTILEPILKDVTSTQHPYGALAVSRMLDETDILHARPKLYVLPDDRSLGPFRKDFAMMPGLIEDRPEEGSKGEQGFMGADKIVQSVSLFRKMLEDNDNRISVESYGKARVFDMLIGDWGRHQDNLKWAGFKHANGTVFYPIPRDRDHAFSKWNGLISSLADHSWALAFIEGFDDEFHSIRSLNYNARHIDRYLLTALDRNDWQQLAKYIQSKVTDSVIDSAIAALPAEIRSISGNEIALKLKARRKQLPEAVDTYYLLLAKEVDVVGSNKQEYFLSERLNNGNVRVRMWAAHDGAADTSVAALFDREFKPGETKEIRLYGLGGKDKFDVKGSSHKSILIRMIGGEGNDNITDNSKVNGLCKKTYVYDEKSTSLSTGPETKNLTSNREDINSYERQSFKYNKVLPVIALFYRRDDGFAITAGARLTTHGFRTGEYKAKHDLRLTASTKDNLYLNYESNWRHALCKWNLIARGSAGQYFPNFNFYGFGNNTERDTSLYEAGYYRLYSKGVTAGLFAERKFFKYASFRIGPVFEINDLRNRKKIIAEEAPSIEEGPVMIAGAESFLDFDMRDKPFVATRGMRIAGGLSAWNDLEGSTGFGLAETFAEYYTTIRMHFPVTIGAEIGGSKNFGENIPLYKYTYLGQKHHLRGYQKHRFTGDATGYLNTELRINLGRVENRYVPFYFGVFGFKDFGKVWYKGKTGGWHSSEGGGIFIAPISTRLTMRASIEHSREEKMLLDIGAGFYLDK
jgi:hypothetical protein